MAPKEKFGSLLSERNQIRKNKAAAATAMFGGPKTTILPGKSTIIKGEPDESGASSSSSDSDSASASDISEGKLDHLRKDLNTKRITHGQPAIKTEPTSSNILSQTPVAPPTNGLASRVKSKTAKTIKTNGVARDDGSSESGSDLKRKKQALKARIDKDEASAAATDVSSSSSSEDSGEESSDEKLANGKNGANILPPTKAKPKKPTAPTPAIDEESSDNSSDTSSDEVTDSEDEEEEEDDDEDDDEDEDDEEQGKGVGQGQLQTRTQASEVAKPDFFDNSGFTLRKASSDSPAQDVAQFLSSANLEGKQLWYFTAPASVPIKVLREMEVDIGKAMAGMPMLQHKGSPYNLEFEPYAISSQTQLIIPTKQGEQYKTSKSRGIDSTFHVHQVLEYDGKGNKLTTEPYLPQPKPVKTQPTNLKPRFTPIGVPTTMKSLPASKQPTTQTTGRPRVNSDEQMKDAPSIPVANGGLKRKLPTDDKPTAHSKPEFDSGSKTATEAKPLTAAQTPTGKPAKRARNVASSTKPMPSSSQTANMPGSSAKTSTPILPPGLGFPSSQATLVEPSPKLSDQPPSLSQKSTSEKKTKNQKLSDTEERKLSETPVPVPPTVTTATASSQTPAKTEIRRSSKRHAKKV